MADENPAEAPIPKPTGERLEVRVELRQARVTMFVAPYMCPTCDGAGLIRADQHPLDIRQIAEGGHVDGQCTVCGQLLRVSKSALVGDKPRIVMPH